MKLGWNSAYALLIFVLKPINHISIIYIFTELLPLGGSFVTLTEFCSTDTGKHLSGIELRYSLKSLCIIASGDRNPLMTASILNIHEAAKWQF